MAGAAMETGRLFAGERIDISADAFDGLRDFFGRTLLGPFKEQVFDEMTNAVEFRRFVARADAEPQPETDARHVRHRGGGDGEAVWQIAYLVHIHRCYGGRVGIRILTPAHAKAFGTISGGPTRRS